ncbi:MAG: hypothetical protein CL585_03610 [Alteromonadaceae bacterium]|nr:hypothetical protein [Alteromonadaceae bacterium]
MEVTSAAEPSKPTAVETAVARGFLKNEPVGDERYVFTVWILWVSCLSLLYFLYFLYFLKYGQRITCT